MAKLEIKEQKKLVLKQVICQKLSSVQLDAVDEAIDKFQKHLALLKVQVFGPLVVKSGGTQIHDDGQLTTDFELYVQAHDYRQYDKFYEVYEMLTVPNCLYLRFEDSPEYLQLAYSKLECHIYENDIQTDGTNYTVYVASSPERLTVDIFRPVMSL
ncbi:MULTISPECIES: AraC family transcriptional regulator [unclassified Streptococcus]|uniref:AraC family transcriptional regulator n=1 Tax=unclassified Streptococcus TaxID=2608887 RepID=UPI00359D8EE0